MPQGAAALADVTSASWSLELDFTAERGPGSGIGNIVQAFDDIDQCIIVILTTIPGEDPFRPTFGCDLFGYIDKPGPAAQAALAGIITTALQFWEPRIKVLKVASNNGGSANPGQVGVTVTWQLKLPNAQPHTIGAVPRTSFVVVKNLALQTFASSIGTDEFGNPITGDTGDPATS